MFTYQRRFYEECHPVTPEVWEALTHDPQLKAYREAATEAYRKYGKGKEYDKLKKRLPMVIFPCSFAPNHGAKGDKPEGLWRCQAGVRLNGLFMYDADELSKKHGMTPVELYNKLPDWLFDSKEVRHIVGAHVTPSGDGLRLIGTCDPERGNLADHQQWLGSILGVPCDESVKDASRGSFMVDDEMILYLDKSIFTYNDEEYDKKYGECYRGNGGTGAREYENTPAADTSRTTAPPYPRTNENYTVGSVPLCNYHDVPYEKIVEVYCARYPNYSSGDRHEHLKVMAGRLRYIVDNSPAKLKQLVRLAPYVKDWEKAEHNQKEIDDLCDGACALKFYISKPKVVKDVLQRAGVVETEETAYNEMAASSDLALRVFAQRLEGLMAEPYKSVMQDQNPMNAIPLIFASGTMFCTLLTRCWYIHYDGKPQRMNPQSLTIAPPASGKGEIAELNKFLLAPVKTADEYARKVENEYKKEYDKRQTSTKALKGDALEEPHLPIRYLTTNTSNSEFLDRLADAKETIDGEEFPLHLYMFDSELMSANKHNGGADWIGKRDMELKAFHNEEVGRDYKNKASRNGLFYVYWTHVTTGTMVSLAKKFTLANIDDGLYMRVAIAPMYNNRYKMMVRGTYQAYQERRARLMSIAGRMDRVGGRLPIEPLMDYLYDMCEEACREAEDNQDPIMDDLRRRAVFYATWFTIPIMVWRAIERHAQLEAEKATTHSDTPVPSVVDLVEVTDADKQFCQVIFDAVIHFQDSFFGNMVQESRENANRAFQPRRRNSRNADCYAALPEEFRTGDVEKVCAVSQTAAAKQIHRWLQSGFIERLRQGVYKKILNEII